MKKLFSLLIVFTFLLSMVTIHPVKAAEKSKAQIRYEAAVKAQEPLINMPVTKKKVYDNLDPRFRKGIMDAFFNSLDKVGKNSKGEQLYRTQQNDDVHLIVKWHLEWNKKNLSHGEKLPKVTYEKNKNGYTYLTMSQWQYSEFFGNHVATVKMSYKRGSKELYQVYYLNRKLQEKP